MTGCYWERRLADLAAKHRRALVVLHQVNAPGKAAQAWRWRGEYEGVVMPDLTLLSQPMEHHECKHKNATRRGEYGLELYRLQALYTFACETNQPVLYTVHDHDLAGGRDVKRNRLEDWRTVDVRDLWGTHSREWTGPSWCDGERQDCLQHFWPMGRWVALGDWWQAHPLRAVA